MTSFEILPYKNVGDLSFGMRHDEVLGKGYVPKRKKKNRRGEDDWSFDGFSVRFGATDNLLCEVGFSPKCSVILSDIDIFNDPETLQKILLKDSLVFEFYGFLVFFNLGITLTGFHDGNESQKAISAFARGHWDRTSADPKFLKWG